MQLWDDEAPASDRLLLLTSDEFDQLPEGTIVEAIDGERRQVGDGDDFDRDVRYGHMAWGLPVSMDESDVALASVQAVAVE